MHLFFQDFTGDLKFIPCNDSGVWQKSRSLGAKNVFNTTSMTAVEYDSGNVRVVSAMFTGRYLATLIIKRIGCFT